MSAGAAETACSRSHIQLYDTATINPFTGIPLPFLLIVKLTFLDMHYIQFAASCPKCLNLKLIVWIFLFMQQVRLTV